MLKNTQIKIPKYIYMKYKRNKTTAVTKIIENLIDLLYEGGFFDNKKNIEALRQIKYNGDIVRINLEVDNRLYSRLYIIKARTGLFIYEFITNLLILVDKCGVEIDRNKVIEDDSYKHELAEKLKNMGECFLKGQHSNSH